ncbi:MAG: insulinase family protein [Acidobacteriota bacterium]|nr:MAG: insulinase family protein [Acidobacteriota bacterium]
MTIASTFGSLIRLSRPAVAAALIVSPCLAAQTASPFSEHVLSNGLRVVMRPVRANPVVCSAVLVRAGVAWEPEGASGASHFLEHLLFNGTESRTQEQLYADVDRIGAYNNATTRADHTLYLFLSPSEHLDLALEIQADMLLHSTLPPDKFEKEKGIVLEEMGRDATNPEYLANRFFDSRLYEGSPYARPVLGTVESIRGLTRETVLAYYRERYVPRRMVLFLAGDFEPQAALESIRRRFGAARKDQQTVEPDVSLPSPKMPLDSPLPVFHQRLEAGRTYLRAAFAAPGEGHPDAVAFGLLVELAADGDASPVGRALKGGDQPTVYDFSLSHDTTGGSGVLMLSAALTGEAPAAQVLGDALSAARAFASEGIDPEALRVLRESKLTEEASLEEQVHYYAMFRAPRLLHASAEQLSSEATLADSVGVDAITRVAERYLGSPRGLVSISGPEQQDQMIGSIEMTPTQAAEDREDRERELIRVLDNGLTVSVRAEPGAGMMAAHLLARNRSALEPAELAGLADLVHRLLIRGSLARDAQGLRQSLRAIGAKLKLYDIPFIPFDDYQTSPLFSFARLEARTERATQALGLLAEIVQTPRFDPEDIARTTAEMADLARRAAERSNGVSQTLFYDLVAPKHPLSRPVVGREGSLDDVSRSQLVEMHRKLFAPGNLILTIRAGRSAEALLERAEQLFGGAGPGGGWVAAGDAAGAPEKTALVAPPPATVEPSRAERELGQRQSSLRLGAVIEVAEEHRAALAVANLLLSDRLQLDLRETQGLAYSIGSSLGELGGQRMLLHVAMGTAPDNVERAEAEIRRLAREVREGPIPLEEIEKIVAARNGRLLMRRLTSINQAYYDGMDLLFDRPTEGALEFLEKLKSVTPEQAREAARLYIDPDKWVVALAR